MRVAAVAVLVLSLMSIVQAQEPDAMPYPVVSTGRLRDALRGTLLRIPAMPAPETATFHVEIHAPWPVETPLDAVRKELAAAARTNTPRLRTATGAIPIVQLDAMPAIENAIHRVRAIRREHAEDVARREVADDLAQFCAAHDCSQADEQSIEGVIIR